MSTRSRLGFTSAVLGLAVAACGGSGGGDSGSTTGAGGAGQGGASPTSSTATTGGGPGTGGVGTGGVGGQTGCQKDADCPETDKPFCDTATGECVGCLSSDPCATGQYCNPNTHACEVGCDDNGDCLAGNDLVCDTGTHKCVGCVIDTDCPVGSICIGGSCVPGCSNVQNCQPGFSCCSMVCYNLQNDEEHCGTCDDPCTIPANASPLCDNGICEMGACANGWADCNGQAADGCEWNTLQDGPCVCSPGTTQTCYQGSPGTDGVGPCHGGTQTCNASGTGYGPCVGQVLPVSEICANMIDEDCDGILDNGADADGDGWTICEGDCCDVVGPGCDNPKLVNPGAFEFVGNGIDDDCDPATSDNVPVGACSAASKFAGITANDVANAMDLCQFTTANPPKPTKKWGVVDASLRLANGTLAAGASLSDIQNNQAAILQNYGTGGIVPKKFATMAGISSGRMRDKNDPGYVIPVIGSTYTSAIAFAGAGAPLGTYLAAHGGGLLPGACGAVPCATGTGANDSVNIRLQIRTPTNAQSFSYDFRFFSGEYQSFQCTAYNDYYLAMLQSGAPGIPIDHNISFDANGNAVSVNNGFFQNCGGNGKNCNACPSGTAALAGTGMDDVAGGGTDWLTTDSPIVPGETITLELVIFDVNDHIYDSLVLLDNFRWSLTPATVGTHE